MSHIEIKHLPFALSLLPFLAAGIAFPVTTQDWFHGRLVPGDMPTFLAGLFIVGAWEWAILSSVTSKKRRGESRLLGRELSSWLWAPPIAFVTGVGCGLVFLSSWPIKPKPVHKTTRHT
jgi:hypothetical protein